MKKLLLTITISLVAFAAAHAQYSQYGTIDSFYQANPDLDVNQYAGRVVNPAYWLVDWDQWKEMDERMTTGGFIRLGISSWWAQNFNGAGIPKKDLALAYAQAIGADAVIYATYATADRAHHYVGFYARQSVQRAAPASAARPSNAQATAAINRFQDAHHEPQVKGGIWYDSATDTYNWIGPTTGQHMSKSASWFLSKFGSYL